MPAAIGNAAGNRRIRLLGTAMVEVLGRVSEVRGGFVHEGGKLVDEFLPALTVTRHATKNGNDSSTAVEDGNR